MTSHAYIRSSCLVLALSPTFSIGAAWSAEVDVRQLETVVVTATMTEKDVHDAPASISVITRDELQRRPVQDLADALQGLAGVHVGGVGLARRGISIRGMSSDYTLTLVNGQRINQSGGVIGHSESDLGWVPAEAIERIEVVRGPMSSLYGSDALGGVVNVITRSATDEWRGSLTAGTGWRDDERGGERRQLGVYAGGPLVPGLLGLNVFAEVRRRESTPSLLDAQVSEMESRDAESLNVSLHWTPSERQRIEMMLGRGNEERSRDALTGRTYYTTIDDVTRKQWSLSHRGDWGNATSQVRYYGASLDKRNRRSSGTPTRPQMLDERTVDARVSLPLNRHLLTVGGELRSEELQDASINAIGRDDIVHRAIFLQDEFEISPDWSLVLGNRLDDHEKFGRQHSPRAYWVHRHSDSLTFKGGVGRGFKAPNLKLLSPDYYVASTSFSVRGNADLQPEISTSYELSADWRATSAAKFQASLFQNSVQDLIQTYCTNNCDGYRELVYENVERARIRGFELGGTFDLGRHLEIGANYTWLQALDLQAERPLATRPRHQANLNLGWRPNDAWMVDLRGQYLGSQVMYSSEVQYPLPAHSLWSLDVNYRISPNWTLKASAENLADTLLTDKTSRFNYVVAGRSFYLGVNVGF